MSSLEIRQLGDVCTQDRVSVKAGERGDLRYIGLEGIEAETGSFIEGELSKTPDAPKANSFYFTSRHVLYGKLRPYLNKVATPEFEGKCSTEIIPLLPAESLNRDYLAYFLRSPQVVSRISRQTAGARMPRADMGVVLGLEIPVPTLNDQHSIVDILKRADGIRRLRKQAQDTTRQLIPALFVDMFGDPATNSKRWPETTIGEAIKSADYGSSTKASDDGAGLPLIRMGNVDYSGRLDLTELKYVQLPDDQIAKYRLSEGDILFNRTNSKDLVGKTGLWFGSTEAVAASYFIRVRVDRSVLNPFYLWAFMNSGHMKRVLFDTARGAIGQSNINAKELRAFHLPLPPASLQNRFEQRCRDLFALEVQGVSAASKNESVFQALLHRAFSDIR
ncbi:MAG TPA: restriction endonuclease subunit S [Gammaproteobacteria bacterium]|nr:restriction endonuclease subunit S [Gammaproteobacteria bacterium]MCP5434434.1 restriction endonuclease subunit S [Chromatiaceae bacterium]HPQ26043.1 restriction endonuclease subunit S [Gammaproteobacteria bacterium]